MVKARHRKTTSDPEKLWPCSELDRAKERLFKATVCGAHRVRGTVQVVRHKEGPLLGIGSCAMAAAV